MASTCRPLIGSLRLAAPRAGMGHSPRPGASAGTAQSLKSAPEAAARDQTSGGGHRPELRDVFHPPPVFSSQPAAYTTRQVSWSFSRCRIGPISQAGSRNMVDPVPSPCPLDVNRKNRRELERSD